MPADYRTPAERMLATLTAALEQHVLGPQVGLLDPGTFPRHRGGVGVLVGFPAGEREKLRETAKWLLKVMGCDWVQDHAIGVEAHLRGELRPAPELPDVHVRSADSCRAAELATVTAVKRCSGPCGQVKPLTEFSWWRKALGRRGPYCGDCDRARQRSRYAARAAQR